MIAPLDRTLEPAIHGRLGSLAKPPGALGRIEDLALRLALISGTLHPRAETAVLMVFAGDHGLNEDGVSAYPSSVTAAMVATLAAGKATANAFARAVGCEVVVVDAGCAGACPLGVIDAKIRGGTRNAVREAAMTPDETQAALDRGAAIAEGLTADVLLIGEMGIGNSASAALLMHRLAPAALFDCVGVGAGHSPGGLKHKREVLERACARTAATDPFEVLGEFGGYEIAMMAGAIFGAARSRRPIILDGFIASAAALVAIRIQPALIDYCIFAHASAEAGHRRMLAAMGAAPLLDLDLRLGEGTGGLLALPLLRAAAALLTEVATLDDVLAGMI